MRFIRYQSGVENPRYGWVLDDKVGPIEGDLFGEYRRLEADISIEKVRLLAPINPGKIICVGWNYAGHAHEHNLEVPDIPLLFLKPPAMLSQSSVVSPLLP